jgi:predicted membrane protein
MGLSVIFRKEDSHFNSGKKFDSNEKISDTVLFWGLDKKLDSKSFKGGEVNAVFGGVKIDLRDVKIAKAGAKIIANAAFGGVEIIVPKECKIVADGMGILGGWENKVTSRDAKEPVLEITGTAVFGGVEIKE